MLNNQMFGIQLSSFKILFIKDYNNKINNNNLLIIIMIIKLKIHNKINLTLKMIILINLTIRSTLLLKMYSKNKSK